MLLPGRAVEENFTLRRSLEDLEELYTAAATEQVTEVAEARAVSPAGRPFASLGGSLAGTPAPMGSPMPHGAGHLTYRGLSPHHHALLHPEGGR